MLSFDEIQTLFTSYSLVSEINDIDNNEIIIYPNPVKNTLFIVGVSENMWMSIYNFQGNMIQRKQVQDNNLDISNLTKGIYLIKFETKSGTITRKFFKQ